ncbi:biotin carboxylase [Mycobacterium sp. ITM-2016-00317]|uniref:biotin carboxylase n=1 Tax=Mycobacterium sp. ITM-2016-00317 TaxID=2099694 RepID=UPI000D4A3255|nr:biotin carboxylase [Mycobacterium sp. ITM-2016-00317]WNG85330.1 biotin carboxylase [Mycobacterium sp. ITM-2016-00317]
MIVAGGPGDGPRPVLHGLSDIRAFFHTNTTPLYFISPTPFNLLGIDRWVRNFFYLNYFDSFEGEHPRVFVPRRRERIDFGSMGDVCNHLLRDPETLDFVAQQGGGKACLVMLDEETQALAHEAGIEVMHPPVELRHRLDSKLVMTELADEAGVPSVPHVMGRAGSYDELVTLAESAELGDDLVIEIPYGNAGSGTFFVRSRGDWDRSAGALGGQDIKVMKRIRNVEVCLEGTVTRHGTVTGPPMTSLVGYPEVTPGKGSWCGNDIWREVLPPAQTRAAREMVGKLGDVLHRQGYRGYFEVDLLHDLDADQLYLGEVNPRLSGVSPMTNLTTEAYADMPLFLFHLLEYMDVDYELDIDEINARWERGYGENEVWGQLVLSETSPDVEIFTATPRTGVWHLHDDGHVSFARPGNDAATLLDESEAFYMRVAAPGEIRCEGAQLGVLVTRGHLQTEDYQLTERCRHWINGIKAQFASTPLTPATTMVSRLVARA